MQFLYVSDLNWKSNIAWIALHEILAYFCDPNGFLIYAVVWL